MNNMWMVVLSREARRSIKSSPSPELKELRNIRPRNLQVKEAHQRTRGSNNSLEPRRRKPTQRGVFWIIARPPTKREIFLD